MKRPNFKQKIASNKLLVLGVVLFVALYLAFFPPIFASIDEHEYAKGAVLVSNGTFVDANPLEYCGGILNNGHYISHYALGKSFFLLPFLPLGLAALLGSSLLLHLAGFFLVILILKKLGIDKRFSLLYLFYPAFVWSSRTLYPEMLVLTMLLAGTYLYLQSSRKSWFFSGLLFGLAMLVRYDAALLFVGFALVSLFKNRRRFAFLLVGFLVAALLLLGINAVLYSSPLQTPYGYSAGHFLTNPNPNFFLNLALYVGILLLAYPLMLLGPLLSRKRWGLEIFISAFAVFYLFSRTSDISAFEFFSPLTFTGRMRYLIPIAGLLIIPYSGFLQDLIEKIHRRLSFVSLRNFFIVIGIFLFACAAVLSVVHQDFLGKRSAVESQLSQTIPENALVIGSSDDCIYFLKGFLGNQKYARIDMDFLDVPRIADEFDGPVFLVQLLYSNKSDSTSRQGAIDSERQKIADFITQNASRLFPVFETKTPHFLKIYRVNPEP